MAIGARSSARPGPGTQAQDVDDALRALSQAAIAFDGFPMNVAANRSARSIERVPANGPTCFIARAPIHSGRARACGPTA